MSSGRSACPSGPGRRSPRRCPCLPGRNGYESRHRTAADGPGDGCPVGQAGGEREETAEGFGSSGCPDGHDADDDDGRAPFRSMVAPSRSTRGAGRATQGSGRQGREDRGGPGDGSGGDDDDDENDFTLVLMELCFEARVVRSTSTPPPRTRTPPPRRRGLRLGHARLDTARLRVPTVARRVGVRGGRRERLAVLVAHRRTRPVLVEFLDRRRTSPAGAEPHLLRVRRFWTPAWWRPTYQDKVDTKSRKRPPRRTVRPRAPVCPSSGPRRVPRLGPAFEGRRSQTP